jgi:hypothetical protein
MALAAPAPRSRARRPLLTLAPGGPRCRCSYREPRRAWPRRRWEAWASVSLKGNLLHAGSRRPGRRRGVGGPATERSPPAWDRPVRASRRLTTIDAEPLCSCGFPAFSQRIRRVMRSGSRRFAAPAHRRQLRRRRSVSSRSRMSTASPAGPLLHRLCRSAGRGEGIGPRPRLERRVPAGLRRRSRSGGSVRPR